MQTNALIALLAGTPTGGSNNAAPGAAGTLLPGATMPQQGAFAPFMEALMGPNAAPMASDMDGWVITDAPVLAGPELPQGSLAGQITAYVCAEGGEAATLGEPGAAPEILAEDMLGATTQIPEGDAALTASAMDADMLAALLLGGADAAEMAEDAAQLPQANASQPAVSAALYAAQAVLPGTVAATSGIAQGAGQPVSAAIRRPGEQAASAPTLPSPQADGGEAITDELIVEPIDGLKRPISQLAQDARGFASLPGDEGLPPALAGLDRSGFSLKQSAPLIALNNKPVFAQSPMEQVRLQLSPALERGQRHITIQMQPGDLGRVDVKLQTSQDGTTQVTVRADRAETLDLLQRDVRHLERSLQDSGLKPDSIQFQLRGGADGHAGSQQQHQQHPQSQQDLAANADGGEGGLDQQPQDGRPSASPYLPAQELALDLADIPHSLLHSGLMASLSSTYQPHYEMRLNIHA